MKNLKSPFKMKPGRGNNPKTGHGMPSQLMSGSPLKQQQDPPTPPTPSTMGIQRVSQSGSWGARPYEHTLSQDNTYMYRKNSQGGIVGRAALRDKRGVEKLRSEYNRDLSENQFRRGRNATTQNAIERTITNVPQEQAVQTSLRKARYDQAGNPTDVSAAHIRKSRMVQARDRNRRTM